MKPKAGAKQADPAALRRRVADLGLIAWLALYAFLVFQAVIGIVFPDAGIPNVSRTLEETVTSCEAAVGVTALAVLILLLTFAVLWEPPAERRSAPLGARPGNGFERECILLVAVSAICATLAVACLPYRPGIFDFLAVFLAGTSPGFVAASLLWASRAGSDLWLW